MQRPNCHLYFYFFLSFAYSSTKKMSVYIKRVRFFSFLYIIAKKSYVWRSGWQKHAGHKMQVVRTEFQIKTCGILGPQARKCLDVLLFLKRKTVSCSSEDLACGNILSKREDQTPRNFLETHSNMNIIHACNEISFSFVFWASCKGLNFF